MAKNNETFICKECGMKCRSAAYTPLMEEMRMCPQCYSQTVFMANSDQKKRQTTDKQKIEGCKHRILSLKIKLKAMSLELDDQIRIADSTLECLET